MSSPVLSFIKTTQEQRLFADELASLKNALYQDQAHFDEVLNGLRPQIAKALATELSASSDSREDYLNGLLEELQRIQTIGLTLAFEPSNATINKIYDWIASHTTTPTLIDIDVNPRILGGVIIVSKGTYSDFSVKKMVDHYLSEHKTDIIQNLNTNKRIS